MDCHRLRGMPLISLRRQYIRWDAVSCATIIGDLLSVELNLLDGVLTLKSWCQT